MLHEIPQDVAISVMNELTTLERARLALVSKTWRELSVMGWESYTLTRTMAKADPTYPHRRRPNWPTISAWYERLMANSGHTLRELKIYLDFWSLSGICPSHAYCAPDSSLANSLSCLQSIVRSVIFWYQSAPLSSQYVVSACIIVASSASPWWQVAHNMWIPILSCSQVMVSAMVYRYHWWCTESAELSISVLWRSKHSAMQSAQIIRPVQDGWATVYCADTLSDFLSQWAITLERAGEPRFFRPRAVEVAILLQDYMQFAMQILHYACISRKGSCWSTWGRLIKIKYAQKRHRCTNQPWKQIYHQNCLICLKTIDV